MASRRIMGESGNNPKNNSFDKIIVVVAVMALAGFLLGLYKIMS